jgi:DNA-binding response OmpR family regulator
MSETAGRIQTTTIVIADDDDDLRAVYGDFLRASGFVVYEAEDGEKTLERVRQVRPELLVLDLWMPALNGLEVLDRLRHEPSATHMKVVMLSNLGEADARLESFEAGAIAYLIKGISLEELLSHIRLALARLPASSIDLE